MTTQDNPPPVLRRLADEVTSGACPVEQALIAAFQLGYIQRDIDVAEANRRVAYRCPECCDTGCIVEPSIPVLVTEADGLVPCPYCKERIQKVIAIRQILPSALNAEAIEFLRDNAVEILGEPK